MSYIDESLSSFPTSLDNFLQLLDLPASQVTNATRYTMLRQKTRTSEEETEFQNLTSLLQEYILTPEVWNKFASCVYALEKFFSEQTIGYLTTKQEEWNAILEKFSYKGQYNSTITYQKWNVVTYNNESYLSKTDNNLNYLPTNNIYWSKIAEKGDQGVPGIGLSFVGGYDNAISYTVGNAVNYLNDIYYCVLATTGNLPTNETYWNKFMSGLKVTIQDTEPNNPFLNQIWIETT